MAKPVYTPPPNPAPVLGDPNFSANADGFLGWFPTMGTYMEDMVNWLQNEYVAQLDPGTAAAPAMAFKSDPDTGHYLDGLNRLGAATGGTRRTLLSSAAYQIDVPITGTAVVSSASDTTAGRLLKTGAGPAQAYRQGNILGTVSQSGGVPTGAVIQRGSNANGEFVRYADGTQICWGHIAPDLTYTVNQTFPMPATFSSTPAGGITGVRSGTATAINNFESIRAHGTGAGYDFFLRVDGTGSNGSGAEYQFGFHFVGRWF